MFKKYILQEKLVHEAMARHMQPHALAGAMYPGLPMGMYGASAAAMQPMQHMLHAPQHTPQPQVEPEKVPTSNSGRGGDDGDQTYVQQLQSEWRIKI